MKCEVHCRAHKIPHVGILSTIVDLKTTLKVILCRCSSMMSLWFGTVCAGINAAVQPFQSLNKYWMNLSVGFAFKT